MLMNYSFGSAEIPKRKKKGGGSVWGSFKEKYGTLQKKKSTNQAPKKMTLDEVPAHSSWLR